MPIKSKMKKKKVIFARKEGKNLYVFIQKWLRVFGFLAFIFGLYCLRERSLLQVYVIFIHFCWSICKVNFVMQFVEQFMH